ncbi:MAG: hypothetical protein H8E13_08445 [Actinobacteria bacterium]|nr:hypothetical protein [Actinomycetota bacterium]
MNIENDNSSLSKDKIWIREALSHQETEQVPYHFDFTPPARVKLEKFYNNTLIEDKIRLPIRWGGTNTIKPLYADPKTYGKYLKDEFGVTWLLSDNDRGTPVYPSITEPDLSGYSFPDPTLNYRFENLEDWCDINKDHFRLIWAGDLWERATFIRGMENILLDLIQNKKFALELLRELSDFILKTMGIIIERFDFEAFSLSDDYGAQNSMLMSPRDWRKFIKPYLAEIIELAKKHKKYIMLHSCGNIYKIVGDLVDIGLDILHPIQPEAMDIFKLKKEFGKDITFQGGLRTQDLLPCGTEDEIMNEIRVLKERMGKGGGYIL